MTEYPLAYSENTNLTPPPFPLAPIFLGHSQSVDRSVKLVSEASKTVYGLDNRLFRDCFWLFLSSFLGIIVKTTIFWGRNANILHMLS